MAKLKQDNLGAKGEIRFSEWCEDEGLICNKALRDRAGWDYIVDFEHDEGNIELLDQRKHPLSCVVQVKTIQDTNDIIAVKLNMAERLAKEPKPAFFVVLKVDNKKNFTSAHVIHVMDECLFAILKRLRLEESRSNRKSINKKRITFKATKDNQIELSGDALKRALVKHAGTDLQKYIVEKSKKISSLGYEATAYEGKLVLTAPDLDALINIFLGSVKDVPVDSFESYETRFGITLPHVRPTPGKITITPNPTDKCKVKLKNPSREYPLIIEGEVYHTPPILGGRKVTVFNCGLLKITVDHSVEGSNIAITQDALLEGTLEQWETFHSMRWLIQATETETEMEISTSKFGKILSLSLMKALDRKPVDENKLFRNAHNFELLNHLQRLAGADRSNKFLIQDIKDAQEGVAMLSTLVSKKGLVYVTEQVPDGLKSLPDKSARVINRISIGNVIFGYFGEAKFKLDFDDNETRICLSSLELKGAEIIGDEDQDFEQFKRSISHADENRLTFSAES